MIVRKQDHMIESLGKGRYHSKMLASKQQASSIEVIRAEVRKALSKQQEDDIDIESHQI